MQRHPLADQIDRAHIAVVVAQDLRHPRRLDLRPPLQQPADHRLQRIQHRARRRALITRRLARLGQPLDRPPVDPQPPRDLALRHPVGRHRPHLCPLHRAAHLLAALPSESTTSPIPTVENEPDTTAPTAAHFSLPRRGAVLGSRHQAPTPTTKRRSGQPRSIGDTEDPDNLSVLHGFCPDSTPKPGDDARAAPSLRDSRLYESPDPSGGTACTFDLRGRLRDNVEQPIAVRSTTTLVVAGRGAVTAEAPRLTGT